MSSMLLGSLALAVFGGHGGCKSHRTFTYRSCETPMVVYGECCSPCEVGVPYANTSVTPGGPLGPGVQPQRNMPQAGAAPKPASPAPSAASIPPPSQRSPQPTLAPTPKPQAVPTPPKPAANPPTTSSPELKSNTVDMAKFIQGSWRIVSHGTPSGQAPAFGDATYEYRVAVSGDRMKIIFAKGGFAFDGSYRIGAIRPDGSAEIDLIDKDGRVSLGLVETHKPGGTVNVDHFDLIVRWDNGPGRPKDFSDEAGGNIQKLSMFRGGREAQ